VIALLRGQVAALVPGEVVLDVAGVGYRVRVPTGARLAGIGADLVLHTHLAVREDALDLYGFPVAADRDLFTVLLGISGVGPRIALAAVDTLGADGIRRAVATGDVTALTAIPGVGRKGAERMVLELRGKLGALPGGAATLDGPATRPGGDGADALDPRSEARLALAALGYGAAEVEQALAGVDAGGGNGSAPLTPEALIRAALRRIAR
jgi:Holliday junction DNA helicase RuvA